MKVITGNPVIINKTHKSPNDYYIAFDGKTATAKEISAFQKFVNGKNDPLVKLKESGNITDEPSSMTFAINKYGNEYDALSKDSGKNSIWDTAGKGLDFLKKGINTFAGSKKTTTPPLDHGGSPISTTPPDKKPKSNTIYWILGGVAVVGVILLLTHKKESKIMFQLYDSENRKFCLFITIKCKGKKKFRVFAEEYGKRNSKYADREIIVDGTRTIFFSFPVTPKQLIISALNVDQLKDKEFEMTLIEAPLTEYNIWMDAETEEFMTMAIHFAQMSGFEDASPKGRLFRTPDNKFRIRYYDIITDPMSGAYLSTPARIGHTTGIMDVSKQRFDKYTIPSRVTIEAHEFCHKYKNPKIHLPISHETGADINAIYLCFGMGFSKIDIICVFANVFLKAQTQGNMERMRKINDYINKFENGEFAEKK